MCAKFMTIHDFLEKLVKNRRVSKQLLVFVESRYQNLLKSLIEWCIANNIIDERDGELELKNGVELLVALPLFNLMPDRYSPYIDWHEFEEYISRIFTELGWEVYTGYMHTRIERFQIDVIALNTTLKLSIFAECKHWRRSSQISTNVATLVNTHINRIEKYLRSCEWVCTRLPKLRSIERIVPALIVLHDVPIRVFNGVPIVSIRRIVDFVVNVDSYIDALNITVFRNKCYTKT